MKERKNIDRLFQESFKDFEVAPSEKVWENIEAELKEKKKRRVIPFWFKLVGVAAALIIGFLLVNQFALKTDQPQNKVVDGVENQVDQTPVVNANPKGKTVENNNQADDSKNIVNGENGVENNNAVVSNNEKVANSSASENENRIAAPSRLKSSSSVAVSNETQLTNKKAENSGKGFSNGKTKVFENNAINKSDKQNAVAHLNKKAKKNSSSTLLDKNATVENAIVDSNKKDKKNSAATFDKNATAEKAIADNQNSNTDKNKTPDNENQSQSGISKNDAEKLLKELQGEKDKTPNNTTTGIAENTDTKKDTAAVATAVPNALEDLLNEKENKVTAKEQKVNRWQITSNVAPIYFSSTSEGSPLDSRFKTNKKTYAPSVSYGAGAKYAINKKLSVKSGVNLVSLEYNTSDVVFFQSETARKIENVTPNVRGSLIQVDPKPQGTMTTLGRTINQFSGDVNQKIGYVEIPVEMSYKLIDRKFGMELIGGLSTLVLQQNEISLVSPGIEMNIGEANNLNSLHFSTNIGVGLKYNFMKSLQATFEPMLKYQINTFSKDSGNFQPYFFGLYTGLSYRF